MRRKIALAVSAVAVAAAVAPLQQANAVCDTTLKKLTGFCSPCEAVNAALVAAGQDPLICFD